MITILPDNEYVKCPLINGAFDNNVVVFTAKDRDEYLGYGAVAMCDDYAEIIAVETAAGMESLEHGIFKSLLNYIERRSVYDVICALDKPMMLKRLGFEAADNEWDAKKTVKGLCFCINLTGYFEKHC